MPNSFPAYGQSRITKQRLLFHLKGPFKSLSMLRKTCAVVLDIIFFNQSFRFADQIWHLYSQELTIHWSPIPNLHQIRLLRKTRDPNSVWCENGCFYQWAIWKRKCNINMELFKVPRHTPPGFCDFMSNVHLPMLQTYTTRKWIERQWNKPRHASWTIIYQQPTNVQSYGFWRTKQHSTTSRCIVPLHVETAYYRLTGGLECDDGWKNAVCVFWTTV